MSEKTLHRAVCDYIRLQYPHVLFNSDLSGIRLTMGQAVQVKALRTCSGFPDIVIYEPHKGYHALFIELKRKGERVYTKQGTPATPHIKEQCDMIAKLQFRGYSAWLCVGFDEAKDAIDSYLR
jgi:hypothetical protein